MDIVNTYLSHDTLWFWTFFQAVFNEGGDLRKIGTVDEGRVPGEFKRHVRVMVVIRIQTSISVGMVMRAVVVMVTMVMVIAIVLQVEIVAVPRVEW